MLTRHHGVDTTAPTVTAFTIPASDTDYVITISTLEANDNLPSRPNVFANNAWSLGTTPVFAYLINMSATKPKFDDAGWVTTKPTSYTIPVANQTGTGTYVLYAWAKDREGNISAAVSDSIALTIA